MLRKRFDAADWKLAGFIALNAGLLAASLMLPSGVVAGCVIHPVDVGVRVEDFVFEHGGVPCSSEDGSGTVLPCYWDAATAGNGVGLSYWITRDQTTHYIVNLDDYDQIESCVFDINDDVICTRIDGGVDW